jgi:hypothetical protein
MSRERGVNIPEVKEHLYDGGDSGVVKAFYKYGLIYLIEERGQLFALLIYIVV